MLFLRPRFLVGLIFGAALAPIFSLAQPTASAGSSPGLLFYLSGEKGTTADVAAPGTADPTFVAEVGSIPDGARGAALTCNDYQRLAWRAPGNLYAQRGT